MKIVAWTCRVLLGGAWVLCGVFALALVVLWIRSYWLCDTVERRWNASSREITVLAAPPFAADHTVNAGWYVYSDQGSVVIGWFRAEGVISPPPATANAEGTYWSVFRGGPLVPVDLLLSLQTERRDWVRTVNAGEGPASTNWQRGYNRVRAVPYWAIVLPVVLLGLLPVPSFRRRRVRAGRAGGGLAAAIQQTGAAAAI